MHQLRREGGRAGPGREPGCNRDRCRHYILWGCFQCVAGAQFKDWVRCVCVCVCLGTCVLCAAVCMGVRVRKPRLPDIATHRPTSGAKIERSQTPLPARGARARVRPARGLAACRRCGGQSALAGRQAGTRRGQFILSQPSRAGERIAILREKGLATAARSRTVGRPARPGRRPPRPRARGRGAGSRPAAAPFAYVAAWPAGPGRAWDSRGAPLGAGAAAAAARRAPRGRRRRRRARARRVPARWNVGRAPRAARRVCRRWGCCSKQGSGGARVRGTMSARADSMS